MARYISTKISTKQPAPSGSQKGVLVFDKTSVAVDTSLAANDVILFSKLPTGHDLIDGYIISTQLDSSTGLVVTVGVLNDAGTDIVSGTEVIKLATTVGRAATGSFTRFDQPVSIAAVNAVNTASDVGTKESSGTATSLLGRKSGDRILAMKVTTVATTKVAGTVTLGLIYSAA